MSVIERDGIRFCTRCRSEVGREHLCVYDDESEPDPGEGHEADCPARWMDDVPCRCDEIRRSS